MSASHWEHCARFNLKMNVKVVGLFKFSMLAIFYQNSAYAATDGESMPRQPKYEDTGTHDTELTPSFPFSMEDSLAAFNQSSSSIRNAVSDWLSYEYDSDRVPSLIDDGGKDLFDQGNKILVNDNGEQTIEITYNQFYEFETFDFKSMTTLPFIALLRIENENSTKHQYTIQVSGNAGADGGGFITKFSGSLSKENFTIDYEVFQISNATDPTICEVYFVLYSKEHWQSIRPDAFVLEAAGSGTNSMKNSAKISGTPQNVVMGYTLLSRFPTAVISQEEILDVMLDFMDILGKMETGCVLGRRKCHEHSICRNTLHNYTCSCKPGFYGDGLNCKDVDECSEITLAQDCDRYSTCHNTIGGFDCVCNDGFQGNGSVCRDIDECALGGYCDVHASCANGFGWHSCTCDPGFYGNGTYCAEIVGLFDVICHHDSITLKVESRYYTVINVELPDLHLTDHKCRGYVDPTNEVVWVFDIPKFAACKTVVTGNSTHLSYTNTISNTMKEDNIYTAAGSFAEFSCVYEKSLEQFSLFTSQYSIIQNIANLTVPFQSGQFLVALNHYTDDTYTYRETKSEFETTDTLYFMVNLQTNDPTLHLVIDKCWVTPSSNVSDSHYFVFIDNECPIISDHTGRLKITQSGDGVTASFQTQVFAFVEYNTTFLHCGMLICSTIDDATCIPSCLRNEGSSTSQNVSEVRKRREAHYTAVENSDGKVLSLGPFHSKETRSGGDVNFRNWVFPLIVAVLSFLLISSLTGLALVLCRIQNTENPESKPQ